MRARCRAVDWAATPLGPVDAWPAALHAVVRLSLDSAFPMCVFAGPDLVLVYNDGYQALLGAGKAPTALGRPAREVWAEVWDEAGPEFAQVTAGGPPVHREDARFVVARGGPECGPEETFWTYTLSPVHDDGGRVVAVHNVAAETTARVRAERALREREARQAFLLALGDAVRPLADPLEILAVVCERVGRHFGVGRCGYGEVPPPRDHFVVARDWTDGVMPSMRGAWPLARFAEGFVAPYRAGRNVILRDARTDPRGAAGLGEVGGVRSGVGVPLMKDGEWVATFYVHDTAPRDWTPGEVALLEEVAERAWAAVEQARAEAALRDSEAKFRTVFDSIDEGFLIHELIRDASGRVVDYRMLEANPAYTRMTGLLRGDTVGKLGSEFMPDVERHWLDLFDRVARTGVPERAEHYHRPTGRWYNVQVSRVSGHDRRVAVVFDEVTARKRAEAVLRESGERQAFLLTLADALGPLGDAAEIRLTAARVLGRHLGASRVAYAEDGGDGVHYDVTRNYVDGAADASGRYRYADFGADLLAELQSGRTRVQPDVRHDARLTDAERQALAGYGIGASLNVPLVKEGRLVAFIGVNYPSAHDFSAGEIALVAEVAERTWAAVERAQAEAALRASEDRQAFVLRLSDALRLLADPVEVQREAARVLGRHLGASRASYAEVEADDAHFVVHRDYADGVPSFAGRYCLDSFGPGFVDDLRAGRTVTLADAERDARVGGAERAVYAAGLVRAFAAVPLVKSRRLAAVFSVHRATPYVWRADEVALVEEVAERTWAAVERARAEGALRASEARARALVATLPGAAVFVVDEALRYRVAEGEALGAVGLTPAEFVGREVAEAVGPALGPEYVRRYRQVLAGTPFEWEHASHGRVFLSRGVPLYEDGRDGGRATAALVVSVDVTAREAAEEALRASEARYRTLVENVWDYAIFLLDADGRVTEWPAGAERVTGFAAVEALGQPLARFYAPEDVAAGVPQAHLAQVAAEGRGEWEGWRVRRDGTRFWANEVATAVHDAEGRLTGFTKISRDLTERRLAEEAAEQAQLQAARDELRRALARAEEAERQRLARELHDQLGQELTAFRLGLEDAARRAAGHTPPDAALLGRLAELGTLAQRMTAGARYLALELRPPELDDVGLESALETYVAEWGARYGVAAEVAVTGLRGRAIPPDLASALYRIAQEALTNVAKHAGATQVSVLVDKPDGEVRLIVEDDGCGFDLETVDARVRRERRLGLAGMRERAALVGGTVAVESSPGVGTTLYARLPVEPPPRGGDDAP